MSTHATQGTMDLLNIDVPFGMVGAAR